MTGLLMEERSVRHLTGSGHPERPARFEAVKQALEKATLVEKMTRIQGRAATEDEVLYCHTAGYLRVVKRDFEVGHEMLSTGDTNICPDSLDVSLYAAGGVAHAVDAVMTGKVKNAFCLVRPPGHHATPNRGMGFCIFNNIAIAARHAQKKHGVERVLIVDWDVHHGNGTQDIFYSDGSVLFFSTHQFPWYPGTGHWEETGEGKGKGRIVNCPFPAGAGQKEIGGAFREKLLPVANSFKPDLVLVSAGFDSRLGDPLGRFLLTDDDFAFLTNLLMEVADKHAKGRLVSALEGGYNLDGLASAASIHVKTLLGA